jgi:hypothetical protein
VSAAARPTDDDADLASVVENDPIPEVRVCGSKGGNLVPLGTDNEWSVREALP